MCMHVRACRRWSPWKGGGLTGAWGGGQVGVGDRRAGRGAEVESGWEQGRPRGGGRDAASSSAEQVWAPARSREPASARGTGHGLCRSLRCSPAWHGGLFARAGLPPAPACSFQPGPKGQLVSPASPGAQTSPRRKAGVEPPHTRDPSRPVPVPSRGTDTGGGQIPKSLFKQSPFEERGLPFLLGEGSRGPAVPGWLRGEAPAQPA